LIEWYDWYAFAAFSIYFAGVFFPSSHATAQLLNTAGIFAVGFQVRPLGGWMFGRYADKFGRRASLTLSASLLGIGSLGIAVLQGYAQIVLVGPNGVVSLLDAFEGRRQLIAYYFMWHPGHPAPEQCEGCTWCTTQVAELACLHSRDLGYAVFCQGPYDESIRYHDFMGWDMRWYSAQPSPDGLLVGRTIGLMHLVCYVRDGDRVFETYWTNHRGVEVMDYGYAL
jgi:hypothetical protein